MIKRFFSKTPSFFKNIRNISILVTALSGTAMFQKNKTLVEIAEIVGAVSTATALMSQLPKEHE
jgi:hypothetical protein